MSFKINSYEMTDATHLSNKPDPACKEKPPLFTALRTSPEAFSVPPAKSKFPATMNIKNTKLIISLLFASSLSADAAISLTFPTATAAGTTGIIPNQTQTAAQTFIDLDGNTNTFTWTAENGFENLAIIGGGTVLGPRVVGNGTTTVTLAFSSPVNFTLGLGNIKGAEAITNLSVAPISVTLSTSTAGDGNSYHSWDGTTLSSSAPANGAGQGDTEMSTFAWEDITTLTLDMINPGVASNFVVVGAPTVVPELSSAILCGIAAAFGLFVRRRR